jgi:hypothetical protein
MAVEQAYINFFSNAGRDEIMVQTIELSHPNFSQTYALQNVSYSPITVTTENGSLVCQPCPMDIKRLNSSADLEQNLSVTIGDVGTIISEEILRVMQADGNLTKPVCKYRAYSSKDLATIVLGTFVLEVQDVSPTEEGSVLNIAPPNLNAAGTGEVYDDTEIPMLKGFIYCS